MKRFWLVIGLTGGSNANTSNEMTEEERKMIRYKKCDEKVGPVSVDNGLVRCKGSSCRLHKCDKGYGKMKTDEQHRSTRCILKDEQTYWNNELWTCETCTHSRPPLDEEVFELDCGFRAGRHSCSIKCRNKEHKIFPLQKWKVKRTSCKCLFKERDGSPGKCLWRKTSNAFDKDDGHDFSRWYCAEKPNAPDPVPIQEGLKCRARPSDERTTEDDKIVGGQEAKPHSWPWIVRLEFAATDEYAQKHGLDSWTCGGTIIDEKTILTAAHCIEDSANVTWIAGDHDKIEHEESQQINIAYTNNGNIHMHPDYDTVTVEHDLAIIKLRGPLQLNDKVDFACLPKPEQKVSLKTKCWAAGWGALKENALTDPNRLQEVDLTVISDDMCNQSGYVTFYQTWSEDYFYEDSSLCAGVFDNKDEFITGGKDACQGDSGGPLLCAINGEPVLIGVTSWGTGCARPNYPGVWAEVSEHMEWIMQHVEP